MQRTKIKCPLCGQEISRSNYSKHQRRHENHPETFDKERKVPEHDGLLCQFCGKECKNKNSLVKHEIRCPNNPNRIPTTINMFNNFGRVAWNKGLTKYTDERVKKYGITISEGYSCGRIQKRFGKDNSSSRPEVRQKISNSCLERSKNGTWHFYPNKVTLIQYNGVLLHSSWEYKFAVYLDENNIEWVRCKESFEYVFDGGKHYYTPDFYLPKYNIYIEIKGYTTDKDLAKWSYFPSDKSLIVLKYDDLIKIGLDI